MKEGKEGGGRKWGEVGEQEMTSGNINKRWRKKDTGKEKNSRRWKERKMKRGRKKDKIKAL